MSLLTFSQQQAIKPISVNNQSRYDQIAKEVEAVELSELLGIELLQDIQSNPASEMNVRLLDPYAFKNCKGNTVTHQGIRYVLAYFNYGRYINQSFVNDTFTGFVEKNRDESNKINAGVMNRLISENRKIAMKEWGLIKEYLDLNYEDYPLWDCILGKQIFTPKFTFLKKTNE